MNINWNGDSVPFISLHHAVSSWNPYAKHQALNNVAFSFFFILVFLDNFKVHEFLFYFVSIRVLIRQLLLLILFNHTNYTKKFHFCCDSFEFFVILLFTFSKKRARCFLFKWYWKEIADPKGGYPNDDSLPHLTWIKVCGVNIVGAFIWVDYLCFTISLIPFTIQL